MILITGYLKDKALLQLATLEILHPSVALKLFAGLSFFYNLAFIGTIDNWGFHVQQGG